MLLLLKNYDVDFSDSKLVDIALGTKNFSCIHFILDQQKNISEEKCKEYIELINSISSKNIDEDVYKLLLIASLTKNVASFETIMCNELILLEAMQREILEIYEDLKQDNISKKIDQVIIKLSSNKFLSLAQKYPNFLKKLSGKITQNEKIKKIFYKAIKNHLIPPFIALGSVGIIPGFFLLHLVNGSAHSYFFGLGGISSFIFGVGCIYSYYNQRYQRYCELQTNIDLYYNFNYLRGYLSELQTESNGMPNLNNQQGCKKNIQKWLWQTDFILIGFPISVGLMLSLLMKLLLESEDNYSWLDLGKYAMPGLCYVLFSNHLIETKEHNSIYNNAQEFSKYSQKCGQKAGYLARQAFHSKGLPIMERLPGVEKHSRRPNFFSNILGGIVACSRPLVDKFRQNAYKNYTPKKFLKLEAFKQKLLSANLPVIDVASKIRLEPEL